MSVTSTSIIPSRMNLQILKQRRQNAHLGFSLLKRKSDALTAKFHKLLRDTIQGKEKVIEGLNEAVFALSNAVWSAGDFKSQVIESVSRPSVTLRLTSENIAGVLLPIFSLSIDPNIDMMMNMGVGTGSNAIQSVKDAHLSVLETLVNLASLQISFTILDDEIKMTNRRINALDNVVLPSIDTSVGYIIRELDETDREEFYRLKMIRKKKELGGEKTHSGEDITFETSKYNTFDLKDEDIVV